MDSNVNSVTEPARCSAQRAEQHDVGMAGSEKTPVRGRPPATSRAQIVSAARRLIEQDGSESLTIRRLAGELDVGPTTLYRHVQDREDLLVLLVNDYVEGLTPPPFVEDPRERIVQTVIFIHDALSEWPWGAEVLTSDGFIGRLGDSSLTMTEAIVSGAVGAGCTHEQAVEVFRNLWYFTVGEILVRARTARGRLINPDLSFDATKHPHLAEIGPRWVAVAERDSFAQGATAFVDGLLLSAARRNGRDS